MDPRRMTFRSMFAVLASLVLAASCTSSEEPPPNGVDVSAVEPAPQDTGLGADWYRKGAFMEIYVRGFKDSDGDGIGDFKGITQSLDYLKDLGITGLWLMPMMRSCDHDHGYAVCDYRRVEPDYGTLEDFDELVTQAHQRGMGIIIDYVMNHSGLGNPLFQRSASSASSPFRSWYVWRDVKPVGWTNWSGDDTWNANPQGPGYYYSVFWSGMPDFNLLHPPVFAYHLDNLRFWLNRGVDGFRFDAIEVLTETDSTHWSNQPGSYSLMKQVRELVDTYPHRYMVCEAPGDPDRAAGSNACQSAFAFNLNSTLKQAARGTGQAAVIAAFPTEHPIGGLATLLSNHDPFAGERPATFFHGDDAQARLAAATLLTLPGTPFLYYGEEVGMSNSSSYGDHDWRLRVPMSWTADAATAGFTTGVPFRKPADNVATHNVALEQSDPGSLLNVYKRLLNLRKADPALSLGLYRGLSVNDPDGNVLAFLRRYGDHTTLVFLNYGLGAVSLSVPLGGNFAGASFQQRFPEGTGTLTADANGVLGLDVPAQSALIYQATAGVDEPYLGATLFIRGEMTDWNATNAMSFVGGGLYQGSFHLKARATPYLFKIADASWSAYNFGAIGSQVVTPGVPVRLEQTDWNNGGVGHDLLLTVSQDGDYSLTLDARDPLNPRLTVTR